MKRLILICIGSTILSTAVIEPAVAVDTLFRDQVAPILRAHCIRCHAGPKAKGGLDLTGRKGLLAGGESGSVLEPGQPDNSLLIDVISGDEPQMPKNADPLSKQQIAILTKWIAGGAKWPKDLVLEEKPEDWWSLKPLRKPPLPKLSAIDSEWVRTPIDAFVVNRMRKEQLAPSEEADRRTLIRRLTFNLHGLPPTPEEIDAFTGDDRSDAYERLVERLLASPRYGERWARHWLDVVHYGDTHGYDKDKRRPHAWPYRDYVIRALNADKPYDQFVLEQLAGDVLFPEHPDGIAATGFIVAGPWDFVGHVELREGTLDKNITRNLDRDDTVSNTMSTFVGMTVHCARCHDHKFDPITQADYYSLQAVFAGIERTNRPYVVDPQSSKLRNKLASRKQQLVETRQKIHERIEKKKTPELIELEARIATLKKKMASGGKSSPTNGYHSTIMPSADHTKWVQVDLGSIVEIEQISLIPARPTDFPDTPGFGFPSRFKVEISNDPQFKVSRTVADYTQTDFPSPGDHPTVFAGKSLEDVRAQHIRVTATKLWERTNDFAFALGELRVDSNGRNVARGARVTALDSIEAGRWSTKHLVDGFSSRKPLEGRILIDGRAVERKTVDLEISRLEKEQAALTEKLIDTSTQQELDRTRRSLDKVSRQLARLPKQPLVYGATPVFKPQGNFTPAPGGKPRPIFLLERGSVKSLGALMRPGTLTCVPELISRFELKNIDDEGERRVALARWIVDRKNPLTYRSIVNRVWHYHFGRGIVDSPNDLGHMGSKPTHPQLLDWLAADFRDGRMSLKDLHRLILTSSVYRQRSVSDKKRATLDSGNRFLWRMNRRQLEAEAIRDSVLAVSGKLNPVMYGSGFDRFSFKDDHSPHYNYERHNVDDPRAWKRTVYRFIVRSVPDPFMESLDCADPSSNVPVRNSTITALQALSLLNNKFMVRQAEFFAQRLKETTTSTPKQIEFAYRLALGRNPTKNERTLLTKYANKHGLTSTCRLILNTNEFIFVD